jgi:hypothetical protein
MELKIGLKFETFYNDDNHNNIYYCEVRGIVDDYIIVLLCKKSIESEEYYKTIDIEEFNFNVRHGVYTQI